MKQYSTALTLIFPAEHSHHLKMVLVVEIDKLLVVDEAPSEVILGELLDAWLTECD